MRTSAGHAGRGPAPSQSAPEENVRVLEESKFPVPRTAKHPHACLSASDAVDKLETAVRRSSEQKIAYKRRRWRNGYFFRIL